MKRCVESPSLRKLKRALPIGWLKDRFALSDAGSGCSVAGLFWTPAISRHWDLATMFVADSSGTPPISAVTGFRANSSRYWDSRNVHSSDGEF
jgi:hypothetical protein